MANVQIVSKTRSTITARIGGLEHPANHYGGFRIRVSGGSWVYIGSAIGNTTYFSNEGTITGLLPNSLYLIEGEALFGSTWWSVDPAHTTTESEPPKLPTNVSVDVDGLNVTVTFTKGTRAIWTYMDAFWLEPDIDFTTSGNSFSFEVQNYNYTYSFILQSVAEGLTESGWSQPYTFTTPSLSAGDPYFYVNYYSNHSILVTVRNILNYDYLIFSYLLKDSSTWVNDRISINSDIYSYMYNNLLSGTVYELQIYGEYPDGTLEVIPSDGGEYLLPTPTTPQSPTGVYFTDIGSYYAEFYINLPINDNSNLHTFEIREIGSSTWIGTSFGHRGELVFINGFNSYTTYEIRAYAVLEYEDENGDLKLIKSNSYYYTTFTTLSNPPSLPTNINIQSDGLTVTITWTKGNNAYRTIFESDVSDLNGSTSTTNSITFNVPNYGDYSFRMKSQTIDNIDSSWTGWHYFTVEDNPKPNDWVWNPIELNAFNKVAGYSFSDLTAVRWNAFIDRVIDFLKYAEKHNDVVSYQTYQDHNLSSYNITLSQLATNAKVSGSGSQLTAKKFNDIRFCIGNMNPTGIGVVYSGYPVLGSYFKTLSQKLNQIS